MMYTKTYHRTLFSLRLVKIVFRSVKKYRYTIYDEFVTNTKFSIILMENTINSKLIIANCGVKKNNKINTTAKHIKPVKVRTRNVIKTNEFFTHQSTYTITLQRHVLRISSAARFHGYTIIVTAVHNTLFT